MYPLGPDIGRYESADRYIGWVLLDKMIIELIKSKKRILLLKNF